MGKQKHYNVKSSLGKALIQSRFSKSSAIKENADKWVHQSELRDNELNKRLYDINLKSVTEQNSLEEFLNTAELAGTEFESEKLNLRIVKPMANAGILSKDEQTKLNEIHKNNVDLLRIPRRPLWRGTDMDAETLQAKERESFLQWRRNLAISQETLHLAMTPYEKNLEFWRQLWRVIEKSDVIVQIVDARNPLLFYCADLEQYCKEISENKICILLVNKSDYLTQRQRLAWLKYFDSKKVRVVFWSAAIAAQIEDDKAGRNRTISVQSDFTNSESIENYNDDDDDDGSNGEEDDEENEQDVNKSHVSNKFDLLNDEKNEDEEDEENEINDATNSENDESENSETDQSDENDSELQQKNLETPSFETIKHLENHDKIKEQEIIEVKIADDLNITEEEKEKCKILNSEELIDLFKTVHKHVVDKAKPGCTTIGLVGYPNVGKSSTINALIQNKKVAVSETPGKTKHYQTIFLDEDLLLCDCPGLVFPSFVSTRGELIINGILPIDQMRDYVEPINLLIHHIPKKVIEMFYGIELPKPKEGEDSNRFPTAEEICSRYSFYRGYMNHKGTPDVQRGARYILKDYVNGKLLYCYPPPDHDSQSFQDHRYEISKEIKYMEKVKKIEKKMAEKKPQLTNFDKEFFENLQPKALTKGGIVGYHRKNKTIQRGVEIVGPGGVIIGVNGKPSKKHFNHNKKEKLRRKTSHFDKAEYY